MLAVKMHRLPACRRPAAVWRGSSSSNSVGVSTAKQLRHFCRRLQHNASQLRPTVVAPSKSPFGALDDDDYTPPPATASTPNTTPPSDPAGISASFHPEPTADKAAVAEPTIPVFDFRQQHAAPPAAAASSASTATTHAASHMSPAAPATASSISSSTAPPSALRPPPPSSMLSPQHQQLISRIQVTLDRLRMTLRLLDISEDDSLVLIDARERLKELFLFVVVGEYNSGKSQFINALLGDTYCTTGVLPTTDTIQILRASADGQQRSITESPTLKSVYVPSQLLSDMVVVDSPGTNAILRNHQEITEHFVPQSDLVLFVTSVERPFSESEKQFLAQIATWHKKVLIVLNKVDTLQSQEDRRKILQFIQMNAKTVLHEEPTIFALSALQALQSKQQLKADKTNPQLLKQYEDSGFPALEQYIKSTLTADSKMQLKLESPLGIAERLIEQYGQLLGQRQKIITEDTTTLELLMQDISNFSADMEQDFQYQKNKIDNVFLQMLDKTDQFIAQHIQLSKVTEMFNTDALKQQYERDVNIDVVKDIHDYVATLVDWMVEKSNRANAALAQHLARRNATFQAHALLDAAKSARPTDQSYTPPSTLQTTSTFAARVAHTAATAGGGDFQSSRQSLLLQLQNQINGVISESDRHQQATSLSDDIRATVMQTTLVEVSAVGIAALTSLLALDLIGFAGAGVVAVGGLYVIPYRRAALRADMRTKINHTRTQLTNVLRKHFDKELDAAIRRMKLTMEPYKRFIENEQTKLNETSEAVLQVTKEVQQLKREVRLAAWSTKTTPTLQPNAPQPQVTAKQ